MIGGRKAIAPLFGCIFAAVFDLALFALQLDSDYHLIAPKTVDMARSTRSPLLPRSVFRVALWAMIEQARIVEWMDDMDRFEVRRGRLNVPEGVASLQI